MYEYINYLLLLYLVHVVTNFCLITEYTQGPKSRGRQEVTSATPRSHEEVSYK